jgi:hypothetical protein
MVDGLAQLHPSANDRIYDVRGGIGPVLLVYGHHPSSRPEQSKR